MPNTVLLLVVWVHSIAAVVWVGGAVFYWAILKPALRTGSISQPIADFIAREFTHIVKLSIWILVITGAILLLLRLSQPSATMAYASILLVKIALSAWMFFIVVRGRGERIQESNLAKRIINEFGNVNLIAIIGVAVLLLSHLLGLMVEEALSR